MKGKGGESALEFGGGVVVGFGFGAGASQLPGCETVRRRRLFLFWGGGRAVKLFVVAVCFCFGAGASQLPGCEGEGG